MSNRREFLKTQALAASAAAAGIPLVNVQPGNPIASVPRETCLRNAIEALREMVDVARGKGIALTFENHTGSIAQAPADALAILDAVPGLGLDYDPSHVVACSIRLEDTLPLMKRVAHAGIRNAKPGSYDEPIEGGKLLYDPAPFLDAFRAAGVDAYVSVEYYEPKMRDSIAPLKAILEKEGIPAA